MQGYREGVRESSMKGTGRTEMGTTEQSNQSRDRRYGPSRRGGEMVKELVVPDSAYHHASASHNSQRLVATAVDGTSVPALLDTGSHQIVVRPQEIPGGVSPTAQQVNIQCVYGDKKKYPLAYVKVQQEEGPIVLLRVGVKSRLPECLIVGIDHPELEKLVQESAKGVKSWLDTAPFSQVEEEGPPAKAPESGNQLRKEKEKTQKDLSVQGLDYICDSDKNLQQEEPQFQEA
ncbi:hypothetical protein NDU88_003409 [Pleurodeles waltl]|uniref:Uncharacterized protein n=1 Tax=Pleurodeles waltl TaxID=8319 RepID=A0AAV7TNM1_PLEWA|nr:hypothetical protein NDU88_003409 [Pleurodeles waltl]